jgi:large subunit ribosomal protein L25
MATTISLTAEPRDMSKTPKALRRGQIVPGVVYGHGYPAKSVQFNYPALARVIRQAGMSHVISLAIQGESAPASVLIRDIQHDAVTNRVLHLDLYALVAGEKIRNVVPLVQRGKSAGETLGASVLQTLEALEIECVPEEMPAHIEVDLTKLVDLRSRITVADLVIPEHVTVLTSAETGVAHLAIQRVKAEVEEAAATPEGAAPAAEPAGEATAKA